MYSLQDIKNSRSDEKKYIDKIDVWVFYVVRPLANILTFFALKLKLTANIATLLATLIGLLGEILLFTRSSTQTLVGLIIINLWIVFDCIDGNIARTTKMSSELGEYLDAVSGYIFVAFLYTALGVNTFLNYDLILDGANYNWIYILLGALASMACIFPRLIEHKAVSLFGTYQSTLTDKNSYNIVYILGLNIAGMAGLSNPLMIIAFMFNKLDLYLCFYFVVQIAIAMYSMLKTLNGTFKKYKNRV